MRDQVKKQTTRSRSQCCAINIKLNELNRERRRSEGIGRRELIYIIWLSRMVYALPLAIDA